MFFWSQKRVCLKYCVWRSYMYNTIAFPHPKNLCNIFLLKQIVPGFQSEASAKYNFCAQHLRLHAPAFATHLLWGYVHASPQSCLFWSLGFGISCWSKIAPASCYFIVFFVGKVGKVHCKHHFSEDVMILSHDVWKCGNAYVSCPLCCPPPSSDATPIYAWNPPSITLQRYESWTYETLQSWIHRVSLWLDICLAIFDFKVNWWWLHVTPVSLLSVFYAC